MKIPNNKSQIPNKFQIPNPKFQTIRSLAIGTWILFGIWCLLFGASAVSIAQPKAPHDSAGTTGIITGRLLKDGKAVLGGHQVVLEILSGHKVVLTIPKPTDNNGSYQFKNIFKTPEFAYSISTEFEGKIYRTDFISLGEKDSKKVVDLIVGAGAKDGPQLPPPMNEETMKEEGMGEHAHKAPKKFTDYQLLAVILAIAAVGYAIYQRKKRK